MTHISDEFYRQGFQIYATGGTLRSLTERTDALHSAEDAEHHAAEMGGGDPAPRHEEISKRYRGGEQSLALGFADGALADLRALVAGRRGQRA